MHSFKESALKHIESSHSNACKICQVEFDSNAILSEHSSHFHQLQCEFCGFIGKTLAEIEDHVIDAHIDPDETNNFQCFECKYSSKSKHTFKIHFQEKHGSKSGNIASKLLEKLKSVEDNLENKEKDLLQWTKKYEDLVTELSKTKKDINSMKVDYEIKLNEMNQKFSSAYADNVVLKERNDILFKMSKSYLDKFEKEVDSSKKPTNNQTGVISHLEALVVEREPEVVEVTQIPSESLITAGIERPNNNVSVYSSIPFSLPSNINNVPKKTNQEHVTEGQSVNIHLNNNEPSHERNETSNRFCHFFVNYRRCNYEERTGRKCKFIHKAAPLCRNGTNCQRQKCMYSHPQTQGQKGFLTNQMSMMNPWQMLPPWIHQPQPQQLTHPWEQVPPQPTVPNQTNL